MIHRTAEAIADHLAGDIAAGRLAVGKLLPGERPLCLQLGVGRPLLREAIRLLAARGLVESRHGQGTRVVADHARPVRHAFAGVLAGEDSQSAHLMELRLAIETAVAAAAARRRQPADLEALAAIIEQQAATADVTQAAALDVAFHERLNLAARNPLFAVTLQPITELLQRNRPLELARIGPAAALTDHRAILAAVRARRPQVAALAMRRHLERVAGQLA